MKVYVVYGFSFGECFCDGVFSTYNAAILHIYKDFVEYLTESYELQDISQEKYDKELERIKTWLKESFKTFDDAFIYLSPNFNELNHDQSICYYIEEEEIKN